MAVETRPAWDGIESRPPRRLFHTRLRFNPKADQYAVTGDGIKFVVPEAVESAACPWTVVLEWPATLTKK